MPFSIRPYRRFLPLVSISGFWLLITLLVLSRGSVYAEWVAVDTDADGTSYIDSDSIRRKGGLVKVWTLHDFTTLRTSAGDSFLSVKGQAEYDCAEERYRPLALIEFSGNMGSGKVVSSNSTEGTWNPIAPWTVGQVLWIIACGT